MSVSDVARARVPAAVDGPLADLLVMLQRYAREREWVRSAVERLHTELREEQDINEALHRWREHADEDAAREEVREFVRAYGAEVEQTDQVLDEMGTLLRRLVTENVELARQYEPVVAAAREADPDGVGARASRLRAKIGELTRFLQSNDRWGPNRDAFYAEHGAHK